ncbi:MAG: hypothetical protein Q9210_006034, partial [Variospora velana]
MFSVDEVLNFTVEDLRGLNEVKIQGWDNLPSETRDRCIQELRQLVHQRRNTVQSVAANPDNLAEKLRREVILCNSLSRSSTISTPPFDDEAALQESLRIEKESYNALVSEGGIPSHPVALGFGILENPREYKDIISYWKSHSTPGHFVFTSQLKAWRAFRRYQQTVRRYFTQRGRFPDYQQRVLDRRLRHGLEGDVRLLEDQEQQSKLEDWVEYQGAVIQTLESFEKKVEEACQKLESAQRALAEAGIPGFEGVYKEGNFGTYSALCIEHHKEDWQASNEKRSAQRALELAEKRLNAALSDGVGEVVEKATWINLAQNELRAARVRLDVVPRARDIRDSYINGQRPAPEDVEEWEQWWKIEDKKREALKERLTAESNAKSEVELAEEGMNAAMSDGIGQKVERATLIRLIQEELESARPPLEEAKELTRKINLKGKVLSGLAGLEKIQGDFQQHKILVKWIERQRLEMASESISSTQNTENCDDCRLGNRSNQETVRSHSTRAPKINKSSERFTVGRRRAQTRSFL